MSKTLKHLSVVCSHTLRVFPIALIWSLAAIAGCTSVVEQDFGSKSNDAADTCVPQSSSGGCAAGYRFCDEHQDTCCSLVGPDWAGFCDGTAQPCGDGECCANDPASLCSCPPGYEACGASSCCPSSNCPEGYEACGAESCCPTSTCPDGYVPCGSSSCCPG